MKNYKTFLMIMMSLFMTISCSAQGWADFFGSSSSSASQTQENAQKNNMSDAITAYPVPQVKNFMERRTISEWAKRWDVPNKPCYCYFFIGGTPIGYFITNGKPASTQSYLIPETMWESGHDLGESYGEVQVESPDIDGTYGTNNPGYRFFLANGAAVECSGALVSCIYSDMPLSLDCIEIKAVKKN